jgi:hypothetical protein
MNTNKSPTIEATKSYQIKPHQTKSNQTKPNQTPIEAATSNQSPIVVTLLQVHVIEVVVINAE